MYSPPIREDLIPLVYRAAKEGGVAMTAWVSRAVEEALSKEEKRDNHQCRSQTPGKEAETHVPETH